MITQEFLSQCSDEQINRGVAWIESKKGVKAFSQRRDQLLKFTSLSVSYGLASNFNPCVNPSDIMPIAFANEISIEKEEGEEEWCAMSGVRYADSYYYPVRAYDIFSTNANPYRAICEVYILMSVNK